MYTQICKYDLLNHVSCLCTYSFRVDHFVLNNQLGAPSSGNANSPSLIGYQLPVVPCPRLWPTPWGFSPSALACLWIPPLLSHCWGHVYSAISMRDNFTADVLVSWLSQSFCSLFQNVPWAMDAGTVTQMYPLWLGSPQSIDLGIVFICGFFGGWSPFVVKRPWSR